MIPDVGIKDYYLGFIHKTKVDLAVYKQAIENVTATKEELHNYLNTHKFTIKRNLNINLNDYTKEWIDKLYNTDCTLYNLAIKKLNVVVGDNERSLLLQIVKYCNALHRENKYLNTVDELNAKVNMKFTTYRKYITLYYNKVHKCVLNGMGYKFGDGIGTYLINHWKIVDDPKPFLDYNATNLRKKELIAQGVKLYDDKEAAWYAARNIPYNAVDYRVFKPGAEYYEFTFINSKLFGKRGLEYQRTEYVAMKYRGMSYTKMADELCKTEEDIYNLQVDIKYKLNILLYKDPTKYLKYVRNSKQTKY